MVLDLITGDGPKNLIDIVVDADRDGSTDRISATADHPFYVSRSDWTTATEVSAGSALRSPGSTDVPVMEVANRRTVVSAVYNLSVSNLHTYYVAVDGTAVLVHNGCGPKRAANWKGYSYTAATRKAARSKARSMADRTTGKYRGLCSKCDHYHVDFFNGKGEVTKTIHFRWRN